jgi:hypothetical protein
MKMHDDLRERFVRSADRISPGDPPLERIHARGRRRRSAHHAASLIAIVALAAGVVVPLKGLLDARGPSSPAPRPGGGETTTEPTPAWDPEQNVMMIATCAPEGDRLVVGLGLRVTPDPVAACTEIWRTGDASGAIRSGWMATASESGGSPVPNPNVPPLSLCAGADLGEARVVPSSGPDGCSGSGMFPMPDGYREVLDRFHRALDDVMKVVPSDGVTCASGAEAATAWRQGLAANGFDAWTVDMSDFNANSTDKPCASFAIHASQMRVLIVNDTSS